MANPYLLVRSILETPILDERKWAKVPDIPSDAVLLDMEDSVAPERKVEARAKILGVLADPGVLADRMLVPRVNSIGTEWGRDDLVALAHAGAPRLAYPKVESREELDRVREILRESGGAPDLLLVIESARGIIELQALASTPGVAGLLFGPSDLSVDVGGTLFDGSSIFEPAFYYPRSKLVLTAAAYDLARFDMMFVADLRDLDSVRARAETSKKLGFTGVATFYPPHVQVINDVYTHSDEEIIAAQDVVAEYERALAEGRAATSKDGRALIVQDYKRAQRMLSGSEP